MQNWPLRIEPLRKLGLLTWIDSTTLTAFMANNAGPERAHILSALRRAVVASPDLLAARRLYSPSPGAPARARRLHGAGEQGAGRCRPASRLSRIQRRPHTAPCTSSASTPPQLLRPRTRHASPLFAPPSPYGAPFVRVV